MEEALIPKSNQVSTPIPMNEMRTYKQKENAICKLISDSGTPLGTGFFCQTKIKNKTIKFLLTCNHVLGKSKIQIGSIIQLKDKDSTKNIKITNNRFVCSNEELDYTCIEIFDNENFDNYFEIDPNINCDNPFEQYIDDSFAIMQSPGDEDVSVAKGKIEEIKNNKNIIHSVSTNDGSSGSPIILSTENLNVIGTHQTNFNDNNKGVNFKIVLEDLEKQYLKFLQNNSNIEAIGIYKYLGKIIDKYSMEQFQKNNEKW